jgi:hypothetical protein
MEYGSPSYGSEIPNRCLKTLKRMDRYFKNDLDDTLDLNDIEAKEIWDALGSALQGGKLATSDTDGGALYIGLGGIAIALLQLHLSAVPIPDQLERLGRTWVDEALALCDRAMQPDLIPSSKVKQDWFKDNQIM